MKNISLITVVLLTTVLATSCKKKKETTAPPEPVVNCDQQAERTRPDGKYTYEYDVDNRLVKEYLNDNLTASMEYKDDGRTIVETKPTSVLTYTLNSEGRATKIVETTNTGDVLTTRYTYVNDMLTQVIRENSYGGSIPVPDTTIVTTAFANSNVITLTSKNTAGAVVATVSSTHNLTRPNNIPNARPFLADDIFTAPHDKNLLVTRHVVSSSDVMIYYSYEFDSKARVTKMFLKGVNGSTTSYDTTTYKYRCD